MTSQRAFGIALIGTAVALFLFIAVVGSHASAAGPLNFIEEVQASGLTITPPETEPSGLSLNEPSFVVHEGDQRAAVGLFTYDSAADLQLHWVTIAGSPATARNSSDSFDGRSIYWNGNSILVVDFRAPNDPQLAAKLGLMFLGETGGFSKQPIASSREAGETTVATVQPPHTGDADLLPAQGQRALPVWAGLLWAGLSVVAVGFAGVGGLALAKAARR